MLRLRRPFREILDSGYSQFVDDDSLAVIPVKAGIRTLVILSPSALLRVNSAKDLACTKT